MTTLSAPFRSPHAEMNGFVPRPGWRAFHRGEEETTIAARFRATARERGDALAVADGERSTSYHALLGASTAIASGLVEHLDSSAIAGPVAILLPFGAPMVEAILATLLAGRAYLALDAAWPDSQLTAVVRAASPAAIIAAGNTHDRLTALGLDPAPRILGIDEVMRSAALCSIPDPAPGAVACLFTTSGSSGEPKLVALSHRAVLFDIGRQTNDLFLGPDDRFDLLFSFAFSAALAPLFGALLNGATVCLLDLRQRLDRLPEWLSDTEITISTMNVSTLRSLLGRLRGPGACPRMRLLSVGGEPLLARDVEAFRTVFSPQCVLQNAMAATETRTYAQYFVRRSGPIDDPVPIGWPVDSKPVTLVAEDGTPVPPGEAGEIAVCSAYLASGYSNDPARTRERFLARADGSVFYRTGDRGRFDADGRLHFVGRSDSVAKIRGYRVELLAVQAAVSRHPAVREAAVVAREDVPGERRIVAYVVPDGQPPTAGALRGFLREELPEYMLPAVVVLLESLPLLPNGKLDSRALPPPEEHSTAVPEFAAVAPRDPVEVRLVELWKHALKLESLGVNHDYFELGGDSLGATRVINRINRTFGVELPVTSLLAWSTIEQLARAIKDAQPSQTGDSMRTVTLKPGTAGPALFLIHNVAGGTLLYQHLAALMPRAMAVHGVEPVANGRWSREATGIPEMAAAAVRQIRRIQSEGPYQLGGLCAGGVIAFEAGLQLEAEGQPVGLVTIFDAVYPGTKARETSNVGRWRRFRKSLDDVPGTPLQRLAARSLMTARKLGQIGTREVSRQLRRHLAWLRYRLLRQATDAGGPTARFARGLTLNTVYWCAERAYTPTARLAGPLLLFRASGPSSSRVWSSDPTLGWDQSVCGPLDVVDVAGGHIDMFQSDHASLLTVARHMMACLSGETSGKTMRPYGSNSQPGPTIDDTPGSTSEGRWR